MHRPAAPASPQRAAVTKNQRIAKSFLFNYLKIQDKMGTPLFLALQRERRELDDESMPMIDILSRLE